MRNLLSTHNIIYRLLLHDRKNGSQRMAIQSVQFCRFTSVTYVFIAKVPHCHIDSQFEWMMRAIELILIQYCSYHWDEKAGDKQKSASWSTRSRIIFISFSSLDKIRCAFMCERFYRSGQFIVFHLILSLKRTREFHNSHKIQKRRPHSGQNRHHFALSIRIVHDINRFCKLGDYTSSFVSEVIQRDRIENCTV